MTSALQPATGGAPLFTVVSAVHNVSRYLGEYIASLEGQRDLADHELEIVAVDDGSTDDSLALLRDWQGRSRFRVTVLTKDNGGQASARNLGLEHAAGDWVTFTDPDDTLCDDYFATLRRAAEKWPAAEMLSANVVIHQDGTDEYRENHPRSRMYRAGDRLVDIDADPAFFPGSAPTSVFRVARLRELGLRFNEELRPNFEDGDFSIRYLMGSPTRQAAYLRSARYYYRKRADGSSTLQAARQDMRRFVEVPRLGFLACLRDARERFGTAPMWVQHAILYELSWYFSSEESMTNSGAAGRSGAGEVFIETLREIAAELTPEIVDSFNLRKFLPEWRDILLHGLEGGSWHTPYAVLTGYDARKKLVRVAYRYVGDAPDVVLRSGGEEVPARYQKVRAFEYWGRTLLREHVQWVTATGVLEVVVDGTPVPLEPTWESHKTRYLSGYGIKHHFRERGASAARRQPWKVRLVSRLANSRPVRRLFGDAWVLMDRIHDSEDSGEQLFTYLRRHQRQVNAWFVVERGTADWRRLRSQGYKRVVAHGSLAWKLLMINCAVLVSSHIDVPIQRPPAILPYRKPDWRFVFLQHGVIKDDLSRWLNHKSIDVFVTSTPGEYLSIAGDDTPYVFTSREVRLTGLPRFDRLREVAQSYPPAERDLLLVAPTWRNWLVPPLAAGSQRRVVHDDFLSTEYVREWTAFLRSPELKAAAERAGKKVAFLPHPNIQPALALMELPEHVVALRFDGEDVKQLFARAAVLVTDYSSMAFNAAYLDRPVVYFQFDAERVENGGHVGRAGYFRYERDGFGPVTTEAASAVAETVTILDGGCTAAPEYQARIDEAFVLRDGKCSERVYQAVKELTAGTKEAVRRTPVRVADVAAGR
jgi:glycosyltransferase involved in cell wall biosynthesis